MKPANGSASYELRGTSTPTRIRRAEAILNPGPTKDEQIAERYPVGEPEDKVRYVSSFCAEGQCRDCSGCYHKCSHSRRRAS